jgi:hypothetical protein
MAPRQKEARRFCNQRAQFDHILLLDYGCFRNGRDSHPHLDLAHIMPDLFAASIAREAAILQGFDAKEEPADS